MLLPKFDNISDNSVMNQQGLPANLPQVIPKLEGHLLMVVNLGKQERWISMASTNHQNMVWAQQFWQVELLDWVEHILGTKLARVLGSLEKGLGSLEKDLGNLGRDLESLENLASFDTRISLVLVVFPDSCIVCMWESAELLLMNSVLSMA